MSNIKEILNSRFLGIALDEGETRESLLIKEISALRLEILEKQKEYYACKNDSSFEVTDNTIKNLIKIIPHLNGRDWLRQGDNGEILFSVKDIPLKITVDGETILYRTLPIYSMQLIIPQQGHLQLENITFNNPFLNFVKENEGVKIQNNNYAHIHTPDNNNPFTDLCSGNNPFRNMYNNNELTNQKDISLFFLNVFRWMETVNISDMYTSSYMYKKIDLIGNTVLPLETQRILISALLKDNPWFDELFNAIYPPVLTPYVHSILHECKNIWEEESERILYLIKKACLSLLLIQKNIQEKFQDRRQNLKQNSIQQLFITDLMLMGTPGNIGKLCTASGISNYAWSSILDDHEQAVKTTLDIIRR